MSIMRVSCCGKAEVSHGGNALSATKFTRLTCQTDPVGKESSHSSGSRAWAGRPQAHLRAAKAGVRRASPRAAASRWGLGYGKSPGSGPDRDGPYPGRMSPEWIAKRGRDPGGAGAARSRRYAEPRSCLSRTRQFLYGPVHKPKRRLAVLSSSGQPATQESAAQSYHDCAARLITPALRRAVDRLPHGCARQATAEAMRAAAYAQLLTRADPSSHVITRGWRQPYNVAGREVEKRRARRRRWDRRRYCSSTSASTRA